MFWIAIVFLLSPSHFWDLFVEKEEILLIIKTTKEGFELSTFGLEVRCASFAPLDLLCNCDLQKATIEAKNRKHEKIRIG